MTGDTRPFPFGVFVPPVSIDMALVRFRGINGNVIQGTLIIVDDDDNITMPNGAKINGRSISADGAKLDGIELKATADQTGIEIVSLLEALIAGTRLSHDYLDDVGVDDHHDEDHSIASHDDTTATGAELEALTDDSLADALHRHSELSSPDGAPDRAVRLNTTGGVGVGVDATATLHLKAGTAAAGTAPIKFNPGTLLAIPEVGTIEFDGDHFTITNIATRKVIDRTSNIIVSTVTVASTAAETLIWTAPMAANSLRVANLFKLHVDGIISNNGPAEADEVTIRIKVSGVTKATLSPNTKTLAAGTTWHLEANATQRTLGETGSRAIHIHLAIGDSATGDEVTVVDVVAINTTINMDVTITAQWASAKANNTISLFQGFMEYKN